jgi:hypothetical protein
VVVRRQAKGKLAGIDDLGVMSKGRNKVAKLDYSESSEPDSPPFPATFDWLESSVKVTADPLCSEQGSSLLS